MPAITPFLAAKTSVWDDYAAVSGIRNLTHGPYSATPETVRFEDGQFGPVHSYRRYVAIESGGVVGFGEFRRSPVVEEGNAFDVNVQVRPDDRGRGIASHLYESLLGHVKALSPSFLQARVREDCPEGIGFLERRGFHTQAVKLFESALKVSEADETPWERIPPENGVEIKSLRDLASDPDWDQKLYGLLSAAVDEGPFVGGQPRLSQAFFSAHVVHNPCILPEACFVAVARGGSYVGMSNLFRTLEPGVLETRQTAVHKAFQRRGIALALKKEGLRFARDHGYHTIRTSNASTNEAVLRLNRRLGFVRRASWASLILPF